MDMPPPFTIRVREASSDDAAALVPLCHALGYPTTTRALESRLFDLRFETDHAIFVAEREPTSASAGSPPTAVVVGFAHVAMKPMLICDPYAELLALVVDERHRGRGVGRALLDPVRAFAARHRARALRVRSNVVRERAHRFYEANGFARVKAQVVLDEAVAVVDDDARPSSSLRTSGTADGPRRDPATGSTAGSPGRR